MRVTYGTLNEADPEPYRTQGVGRATEGRDFVPLQDSVVFLANQSEASITLQVLDDEDPERDEAVFVKLLAVQLIKGEQKRLSKIKTKLKKECFNHTISYYFTLMNPFSFPSSFKLPLSGAQH